MFDFIFKSNTLVKLDLWFRKPSFYPVELWGHARPFYNLAGKNQLLSLSAFIAVVCSFGGKTGGENSSCFPTWIPSSLPVSGHPCFHSSSSGSGGNPFFFRIMRGL